MYAPIRLTALVLFASSAIAYADQPGADWMSKEALKAKMQSEGYSSIVVKADDGHWEGEAVKDGNIVEFHADPHTGAITKVKQKKEGEDDD